MQMDVYDAAERYQQENVQLVLLVGKDYGSGSSRDWAAKGPYLLVSFKPELNRLYILPGFLWFYNPNICDEKSIILIYCHHQNIPNISQGIKAVIAESYERIHRSNLVGMGLVPLEFQPGQSADSLGLDGSETLTLHIPADCKPGQLITVKVFLRSVFCPAVIFYNCLI